MTYIILLDLTVSMSFSSLISPLRLLPSFSLRGGSGAGRGSGRGMKSLPKSQERQVQPWVRGSERLASVGERNDYRRPPLPRAPRALTPLPSRSLDRTVLLSEKVVDFLRVLRGFTPRPPLEEYLKLAVEMSTFCDKMNVREAAVLLHATAKINDEEDPSHSVLLPSLLKRIESLLSETDGGLCEAQSNWIMLILNGLSKLKIRSSSVFLPSLSILRRNEDDFQNWLLCLHAFAKLDGLKDFQQKGVDVWRKEGNHVCRGGERQLSPLPLPPSGELTSRYAGILLMIAVVDFRFDLILEILRITSQTGPQKIEKKVDENPNFVRSSSESQKTFPPRKSELFGKSGHLRGEEPTDLKTNYQASLAILAYYQELVKRGGSGKEEKGTYTPLSSLGLVPLSQLRVLSSSLCSMRWEECEESMRNRRIISSLDHENVCQAAERAMGLRTKRERGGGGGGGGGEGGVEIASEVPAFPYWIDAVIRVLPE